MKLKPYLSIPLFIFILTFNHLALAAPVNVNTATAEEISSSLSGIGPAKAEAIKQYCQSTKCTKPEDLLSVKGIGEKTLAKISADLRFDEK